MTNKIDTATITIKVPRETLRQLRELRAAMEEKLCHYYSMNELLLRVINDFLTSIEPETKPEKHNPG